jgi:hypothetical protein
MKFMVMMIPNAKAACVAGGTPDPKAMLAMGRFNEELAKAGVLLAVDGLKPASKGARVAFAGGKPTVTDGPFAEAREVIGGYWLWQVKSKAEAIEWAKRCPAAEGDVIEIRQIADAHDIGPDLVRKEGELIERIAKLTEANVKGARG